jgi:hypothetical protein
MRKRRILSSILVLWGAAVLLHAMIGGLQGRGAYRGGEIAALVFALGFIAFGARALKRSSRAMFAPAPRGESLDRHGEPRRR